MRKLCLFSLLFCLLILHRAGGEEVGIFRADEKGRVHVTALSGDPMGIHTDVHLFRPGWQLINLQKAGDIEHRQVDGQDQWSGRIEVAEAQACTYTQTLRTDDATAEFTLRIKAETDLSLEGVFFWIQMPVDLFAGGWATLKSPAGWPTGMPLPAPEPYQTHILGSSDAATHLQITGPDGTPQLAVDLARAHKVQVQDDRQWNSPNYGVLIALHEGDLAAGQSISVTATLSLKGRVDRSPAELTLDSSRTMAAFSGMGGNYCFGIDAPQTDYTLENLRVRYARTQMSLDLWEPHNDDDQGDHISWGRLIANDRPRSKLRREFLFAQRIADQKIPLCVSVWYLPDWMYENPHLERNTIGRRVASEHWHELVECIGSYLLYLRRRYGVEPELVSLNEPDLGVYVKLTAEEYVVVTRLLGEFLKAHDLKTKILLGDVSNPRHALDYVEALAQEEKLPEYAGAIGFHTWGGALPDDYRMWRQLADSLDLPLLATEVGLDAKGWETKSYETWSYALQEMKMVQNLLRFAQPQAALYWQLTSDYAVVNFDAPSEGQDSVAKPSKRFWFLKHFADLVPVKAHALWTESNRTSVQFTAYVGGSEEQPHYVMHISNPGAARLVTLNGIPEGLGLLYPVVTDDENSFFQKPEVRPQSQQLQLELTAHSLTTLTNRPPNAPGAVE